MSLKTDGSDKRENQRLALRQDAWQLQKYETASMASPTCEVDCSVLTLGKLPSESSLELRHPKHFGSLGQGLAKHSA